MARTCPVKQKFLSIITLHIKFIPSYSIPKRWIYPTNWFHHSLTYHNPLLEKHCLVWIWGLYYILLAFLFPEEIPWRNSWDPTPDLLNQKLWVWDWAICVLTNTPGDSDSLESLRRTNSRKEHFFAVTYAIRTSK